MMEEETKKILDDVKKTTKARARAKKKWSEEHFVCGMIKLADAIKALTDKGQSLSQVNVSVYFDGGEISGGKIKVKTRHPEDP
jgi:hypothetical protein